MRSEFDGAVAQEKLKQVISRVEELESQKADISDLIKDVFAEAKNDGFDVKTIRELIKLRKLEDHERDEKEAMLDLYRKALGM